MRVASVLLVSAAALTLVGCGPREPRVAYEELGCPRCHGFHREGNRYGPPLKDLDRFWSSEADLVAYLENPAAVVERDPRLSAQDGAYELKMQPVTGASREEKTALATWLLTSE